MMLELFISIAMATISFEVCYSNASLFVKKLLFLDKPYPALQLFLSWNRKILGDKMTTVLLPLILVVMTLLLAHKYIFNLLQCPFCLSFILGMTTAIFVFQYTLTMSLIIAGVSLFVQAINNYLRMKAI